MRGEVSPAERTARTWRWCQTFDLDLKLVGYSLISAAAALYILGPQAPGFAYASVPPPVIDTVADDQSSSSSSSSSSGLAAAAAARMARKLEREFSLVDGLFDGGGVLATTAAAAAAGHAPGRSLHGMGHVRRPQADGMYIKGSTYMKAVEEALMIEHTQLACVRGTDPLIWLLMALGFLVTFFTFAELLVMPIPSLSVFVLSVRSTPCTTLIESKRPCSWIMNARTFL